jgi:NDP-sugar pyrophosphorylase family protein
VSLSKISIKKAVILAAGQGTRLGPASLVTPKPLIEVMGSPVIFHTIKNCVRAGIEDIYINLFHLPEKFISMIGDGSQFGVRIHFKIEKELLGTSGAVKNFESELKNDSFMVLYGDNWTDYDYLNQIETHEKSGADMSMVVFFKEGDVRQSGLAYFGEDHRISQFVEKDPHRLNGGWVNAGVYFVGPKMIDHIPVGFSDFGKTIIPSFLQQGFKLNAIVAQGKLVAIDTPELLANAKKL